MKAISNVLVFCAVLAACFLFGFAWPDLQRGKLPSSHAMNSLFGVKSGAAASPEQEFSHAYTKILTDYIRPVDPTNLKYAGMEGLMSSLGDPHTVFMPPTTAEAFNDETKANFGGVGARLTADPLGAKIASVFEDGPAYAAGIREGNIISGVDGQSVTGKEIDDIVTMIKGKEGTVVHLTVIQNDKKEPVVLTIKRARIIAPTVDSKYFSNIQIGYMSILSFSEPTAAQFDHEIAKLEAHPLKGMVIDLRDNPGGLLDSAVDMLSRFFENKLVVKMKFRDGHEESAETIPGYVHSFNYPIAILINEDSASAAEIFSGCLHDYGRAKLVGTHSYGKASVQNVFPLIDQSSAKITIAKYFLPFTPFFGRKVDQDGVFLSGGLEPDVKAELDPAKEIDPKNPKTDGQLWKAIQVLSPQPGL
ncbi:MAG: S41 family peptidase [Fimbriimonas sp.]|nr:S41 family peptidase [Fimbriimonas sp.]